nr:EF hand calcium binding domain containing protein [Hymenolepis microstoma]
MNPGKLLWIITVLWIFVHATAFLSTTIILHMKRKHFQLVLNKETIIITMSITGVHAGWLFICIATALQTLRLKKRGAAIIFLGVHFVSLISELYFLTYVFNRRSEFVRNAFTTVIKGLVENYLKFNASKRYTDWINEKFQCCGLTQWHREWWMDEEGFMKQEFKFAWVPDSCCLENSRYNNCGIAYPPRKPGATKEDKSATDIRDFYYDSGPSAATYWYMRLKNEPCPDMMIETLGETTTYILMILITLSFTRFIISSGAVIGFIGARYKEFNLRELLPPSCFDPNGRILKPQFREMLARMNIHLIDENFRRLWEQKFDLDGIGSISTKQLMDQLNLTEEGVPKDNLKKPRDYKFPDSHRLKYEIYDEYKPILKENPCRPLVLEPVTLPLTVKKEGGDGCANSEIDSQLNEPIPTLAIHFRDELARLRHNHPCIRDTLDFLRYLLRCNLVALGNVLKRGEAEHKGSIPIAYLVAVIRDLGIKVSEEEVKKYCRRRELFVHAGTGSCKATGNDILYEKFLLQLKCNQLHRPTPNLDYDPCKMTSRQMVRYLEDEIYLVLFANHLDFIAKLKKYKKKGIPLPQFRRLIDSTFEFEMGECAWKELVRQVRLINDCRVDVEHFISTVFENRCKPSSDDSSYATNWLLDPQLRELVVFTGEPRCLTQLLLALKKLITEQFHVIDKLYKNMQHVGYATIDKKEFQTIMMRVGLELCSEELDDLWQLLEEVEPTCDGVHKYHQVMRFFLETDPIRTKLFTEKRNKRIHDPNLPKMMEFYQCQKEFKELNTKQILALGKAASEIKYRIREDERPSEERVNELCNKIRPFVISIWTNLRNGFLYQDPLGSGTMSCKNFRNVCIAFDTPLSESELMDLARGLDRKNEGFVNYVNFLKRFSDGHIPPRICQKFDIVHHKVKNKEDGSEIGIREVMDRIRQICLKEHKTLLAGFKAIADPKHSDFITEEDLGKFLRKHGFDLSSDDIYHIRTAYDTRRRGCISYSDFLQQTMDVTKPAE